MIRSAEVGITITELRPQNEMFNWAGERSVDPVARRARGYFALKFPLSVVELAVIAACWLGGLFCSAFPAWRALGLGGAFSRTGLGSLPVSFDFLPLGVVLLLVAPWATHGLSETDRRLMRGLLGPGSSAARIHVLERSRARVVDDSTARLRTIERDLHDGTQAQLVALAMKLGLAREKLQDAGVLDLARVTQLAAGGTALDPEVVTGLLNATRHAAALDALTPREHDVLALMAEGRSNGAIADRFAVSERAVEKHVGNIFSKLGLPPSDSDHRRVLAVLAFLNER